MAAYVVFFSYTPKTWERMITRPEDRAAASRAMIESAGGTLEFLYFMLGDRDGFAVVHVCSADDIAALSIAITSTGAFSHVETRALVAPENLAAVLHKAAAARGTYAVPGA